MLHYLVARELSICAVPITHKKKEHMCCDTLQTCGVNKTKNTIPLHTAMAP